MRKELENKLMDFSFGFARNVWDGKLCLDDENNPYGFPCECGDGWFELIYELCDKLNELYLQNNVDPAEIQILQIKEKYGGLRFYTGGLIDGGHDIIYTYEEQSYEICEVCGKPGKIRDGRWIQTLCNEHALRGDM